jgi:hypothetical protein
MNRRLLYGIALLLFLVSTSCKRSLKGEGPVTTRQVDVSDFTEISVSIPADVKIVVSDSFKCIIHAQGNIAEAIELKVDGDELDITSEYSLKSDVPIELFISLPVIEELEINGSGDAVFVNPAKGDKLVLNINGSGSIAAKAEMNEIRNELNGSGAVTLSGSASEIKCNINGSGDFHAFDCSAEDAHIEINGSGDAELNVTGKLRADIRGSGNIIYKGQPHLVTEIIGSGNIRKAD